LKQATQNLGGLVDFLTARARSCAARTRLFGLI
jgi:hypothetical protein